MKKLLSWYLSVSLVVRILTGFISGALTGILLWFFASITNQPLVAMVLPYISPWGLVLVNMLKMIVVPVIFFSLVTGAASLPLKRFGVIGVKVIGWYLFSSFLAAVIGVLLALLFNPGGGADLSGWEKLAAAMPHSSVPVIEAVSGNGLSQIFLNMFQNPFGALASGDFLPIIVFSLMFGIGIRVSYETTTVRILINHLDSLVGIMNAARDVIFKLVDWILEYSPIGVFALSIVNFSAYGPDIVGPYIRVTLGIIVGIFIMVFIVYSALIFLFTRANPLIVLKKIQEAMITAFITRSSAATLPVSIRVASDDLKIKNELCGFSLPLGATINMDGVCVHLPMFAVLAANMFHIDLTFTSLAVLVVTTVLASIGAGGVPGGSIMLLFIILGTMGLNHEQIAIIVAIALGINPILDMFETANNVTGDIVCTYAVACNESLLDNEGIEQD